MLLFCLHFCNFACNTIMQLLTKVFMNFGNTAGKIAEVLETSLNFVGHKDWEACFICTRIALFMRSLYAVS